MNEQDFDNNLRKAMASERDFPFSDDKWAKMDKHLDNFKAERSRRRLWYWLALPFALLLTGLITVLGLLNRQQNDVRDLRQEVQTLLLEKKAQREAASLASPSALTQTDTVYQHVVVRRYDTIFQTLVQQGNTSFIAPPTKMGNTVFEEKGNLPSVKENVSTIKTTDNRLDLEQKPPSIPQNNPLSIAPQKATDKAILTDKATDKATDKGILTNKERATDSLKTVKYAAPDVDLTEKSDVPTVKIPTEMPIEKATEIPIKTALETPPKTTAVDSNLVTKTDSIHQNRPLSIGVEKTKKTDDILEKTPEKVVENAQNKQKAKRLPILKPIKLTGFELGATGGVAFIRGENVLRQNGYSVGGRGAMLLGERVKVVAEAQFVDLSFESDKLTGKNDIPTINPPSPDAEFEEVKVTQPYGHFTLGLQYILTQGTRLQPYIGASALGQLKLEETFTYKFKNKATGDDEIVKTVRNEAIFHLPYLRLNAGATYPIFNKFSAQVEGGYDVNIDNHRTFKPLWQVKCGIFYRF